MPPETIRRYQLLVVVLTAGLLFLGCWAYTEVRLLRHDKARLERLAENLHLNGVGRREEIAQLKAEIARLKAYEAAYLESPAVKKQIRHKAIDAGFIVPKGSE
jgi:hypothetical protein